MESRGLFLAPCSSFPQEIEPADSGAHTTDGNEGDDTIVPRPPKKKKKKRGIIIPKPKIGLKHHASSSSCSSSSTSSAATSSTPSSLQRRRTMTRGRQWGLPKGGDGGGDGVQDLALPLGMSFAAVVSQVLAGINESRRQIPLDRISLICTTAVKESVVNIYGDRFNCFLLNFEKSFGSTLRTLQLINEASAAGYRNRSAHMGTGYRNGSSQVPIDEQGSQTVNEPSIVEPGNSNCISFPSSSSHGAPQGNCEVRGAAVEKFEDIPPLTTMNNLIVIHGQMNRELASASHSFAGHGSNHSILSTFEKSVMEQTRSNDLKAFEIGLISRKLELKESQLAISSYANMLDKIKISMGISRASFKEEKLRNQMLDTRHAEFLRRCIDVLVAGLIIMSGCLGYGTYNFSYQRITEATSACSATPKESKSWWIPKPMASFNSGWLMLRCHVVALTRMFFGFALIVTIAYFVFQRSAMSTPTTMPVTFILLLGFLCGIAGKLCVDTLGGSGLCWLLYWEALCLVHFWANIFPSVLYRLLYGAISVSPVKAEGRLVPYWFRRFMFNFILSIIFPALCGLLPFASLGDWKEHFSEKIYHLVFGIEIQE